ncbi:hypothetical protein MKW98_007491 [Papaver atlanticum]|uniref:Dynein light chain n=1 Tax=Papaver atlanticum TaxID=357466 RepID=A0AAD4SCT9_9MAGN|nr:hypothetical protein MKW98_007491 [Papaver atlanticum]
MESKPKTRTAQNLYTTSGGNAIGIIENHVNIAATPAAKVRKPVTTRIWNTLSRKSSKPPPHKQEVSVSIDEFRKNTVMAALPPVLPTLPEEKDKEMIVIEARKSVSDVEIIKPAKKSTSEILQEEMIQQGRKSTSHIDVIFEPARKSVSRIEKLEPARKSVSHIDVKGRKSVSHIEMNNVKSVASFLNVKVVAVDMPGFMQVHCFRCARRTYDGLDSFSAKHMAYNMKKEFDRVYGPAWHCIVGSSFGSFVTHSTGFFLYFSIEKIFILIFKTKVQKALD